MNKVTNDSKIKTSKSSKNSTLSIPNKTLVANTSIQVSESSYGKANKSVESGLESKTFISEKQTQKSNSTIVKTKKGLEPNKTLADSKMKKHSISNITNAKPNTVAGHSENGTQLKFNTSSVSLTNALKLNSTNESNINTAENNGGHLKTEKSRVKTPFIAEKNTQKTNLPIAKTEKWLEPNKSVAHSKTKKLSISLTEMKKSNITNAKPNKVAKHNENETQLKFNTSSVSSKSTPNLNSTNESVKNSAEKSVKIEKSTTKSPVPNINTTNVQTKNLSAPEIKKNADTTKITRNKTSVRKKRAAPHGNVSKNAVPKKNILSTIEEDILGENFLMITNPGGKKQTTTSKPVSTTSAKSNGNLSQKLRASPTKQNYADDDEDIESLDVTIIPTTTQHPTTTAIGQCDDVTNSGCDILKYEICSNKECTCFPGFARQTAAGTCRSFIRLIIELIFKLMVGGKRKREVVLSTPLADEMVNRTCPDDIDVYIRSTMDDSSYAADYYSGDDFETECYQDSSQFVVNFTLKVATDTSTTINTSSIANIFMNTAPPPSLFAYTAPVCYVSKAPPAPCVSSQCGRNAVCNGSACSCLESYVDLSPASSGMSCLKCGSGCQNGGICYGNITAQTVACQCSSDIYFGDTCQESYAAIIAGSVVAGVLVIAAVISFAVLYHRSRKQRKSQRTTQEREAVDQYLENTNFRPRVELDNDD